MYNSAMSQKKPAKERVFGTNMEVPPPGSGTGRTMSSWAHDMPLGSYTDCTLSESMNLYNVLTRSGFGCRRRKQSNGFIRCWKLQSSDPEHLTLKLSGATVGRLYKYRLAEKFVTFNAAADKLLQFALDAYERGEAQ